MQMSEEKYDVVNVVNVFGNKKAFRLDSIKKLNYSPNYNAGTTDYCVELGTNNKDENSIYVTPDGKKHIKDTSHLAWCSPRKPQINDLYQYVLDYKIDMYSNDTEFLQGV